MASALRVPASGRECDWRVALVFTAVAMALFHQTVFGGHQFFYRDLALQWHPQVEAFVRAVAAGSWPVWNPYVSFGQPLLANPNAQILYPFTWLQLLLPAWTFYTWYTVLHFVLAGFGVYALGRHLGLSRGGSLTAGLLWVLSGPFLSLVNLWNHLAGAAWIPWIVRAGDRAVTGFSVRASIAWGGTLALTVLAGSPESGLMAVAVGAFLAVRHSAPWWREPRRLLEIGGGALLALGVALALTAGQWLPALDIARSSARADMAALVRDYWSIHPWTLAEMAFPVFADRLPLHAVWRDRWYESREPFLGSLYLGLPALALMLAGPSRRPGRRWTWSLLALAALSILFALGRHAPLYEALVTAVPPLRSLRFPAKTMLLASLCASLVGGHGFEAWRERHGRDLGWTVLTLALLLLAAVALGGAHLLDVGAEEWGSALLLRGRRTYTELLAPVSRSLLLCGALAALAGTLAGLNRLRLRPSAVAWVILLAAVGDLAAAHVALNPTAPRTVMAAKPLVLSVAPPAGHQRMFVFDYTRRGTSARLLGHHQAFVTKRRQEDWEPWHGALALRTYGYPSLLGLWGREGSYGIDPLQLHSADVTTVDRLVDAHDQSPAMLHRLLRLGAVDTVVALHQSGFEELSHLATLPSPFLEPIEVFRVPEALPRAFVVGRARVAPVGQGWKALLAPDFDPAREVVLPEGPVLLSGSARGTCWIVELRPDRVTLEAQLAEPGYVVLVDAYDPGWKATVDGRDARVLRANVAFRAVQAPAGRHQIRFEYRPAAVKVGLAITTLAALAVLAAGLAGLRVTRRASETLLRSDS